MLCHFQKQLHFCSSWPQSVGPVKHIKGLIHKGRASHHLNANVWFSLRNAFYTSVISKESNKISLNHHQLKGNANQGQDVWFRFKQNTNVRNYGYLKYSKNQSLGKLPCKFQGVHGRNVLQTILLHVQFRCLQLHVLSVGANRLFCIF